MATSMRPPPDLGIPEVKPAIESIAGRWAQKISPRRRHGIVQGRLWALLTAWAGTRGEVASEWRVYLLSPGRKPSSLVPDVAYFSFERLPRELGELREQPTTAPDIAVEIVSPGDRRVLIDQKIALYLAHGSNLAIVVDPIARTLVLHEPTGTTTHRGAEVVSCDSQALTIDLATLFNGV